MNVKNHTLVNASANQLSLFSEVKKEGPVLDTVHQYFLIISPPNEIKSKVKSLKYKLHRAGGLSDYNLFSVPHISLMSFHTMRPVNERFFQALQQLFSKNHFSQRKVAVTTFFCRFQFENMLNRQVILSFDKRVLL